MTSLRLLLIFIITLVIGCGGSSSDLIDEIDDIDDVEDITDDPPRKTIDYRSTGVNAFGNQSEFGSPCEQFNDVRNTLRLRFIRMLMRWDNNVQPAPGAAFDFSFYDRLVSCIPDGVQVLVVTTGVPSWMANSANWVDGNPRTTFAENWLRPLIQRYGNNGKITAWQIWNEPNMLTDNENVIMQVADSPENYVELLGRSYSIIKDLAPNKLVLNAATTAIAQNFPDTLRYNRRMRDAGAEQFLDVYALHYYGKHLARFLSGVKQFLNEINKPLWITESGIQGVDNQLAYVETIWPYLQENLPRLERIYYYQYSSTAAADNSFGLRTTTAGRKFSDLYIHLRDR